MCRLYVLLPDSIHKAPSRAARAEERPFLFVSGVIAGCMLFWHCIVSDNCQDNCQTAFLRKWNEGKSQEGRGLSGVAFGTGEAGDTPAPPSFCPGVSVVETQRHSLVGARFSECSITSGRGGNACPSSRLKH